MNSKFNAIYLALFLLVAITPLHVQAGTPTAPVVEQMANGTCEIVPNPDCRLVAGGCKGKFRETTWCTVNLPRGDGGNFACKNFGGGHATWCLATFTENSNGDMHSGEGHKSYSDLIRIEEEQEARIRNLDEQITEQANKLRNAKNSLQEHKGTINDYESAKKRDAVAINNLRAERNSCVANNRNKVSACSTMTDAMDQVKEETSGWYKYRRVIYNTLCD